MTLSSPSRPYLDGKKLNKIEQNKAAKDGLLVGSEIEKFAELGWEQVDCLLYTSPSPRDYAASRMPSSA